MYSGLGYPYDISWYPVASIRVVYESDPLMRFGVS
jgi:hypothetical protein